MAEAFPSCSGTGAGGQGGAALGPTPWRGAAGSPREGARLEEEPVRGLSAAKRGLGPRGKRGEGARWAFAPCAAVSGWRRVLPGAAGEAGHVVGAGCGQAPARLRWG